MENVPIHDYAICELSLSEIYNYDQAPVASIRVLKERGELYIGDRKDALIYTLY